MSKWFLVLLSTCVVLSAAGCGATTVPDVTPPGRAISLADDVQPIFDTHCSTCHFPGSSFASGLELDLRPGATHASAVNVAAETDDQLKLIVPGDAQASLLFLKVLLDDPPAGQRMPLFSARLTEAELQVIEDWIADGAQDN